LRSRLRGARGAARVARDRRRARLRLGGARLRGDRGPALPAAARRRGARLRDLCGGEPGPGSALRAPRRRLGRRRRRGDPAPLPPRALRHHGGARDAPRRRGRGGRGDRMTMLDDPTTLLVLAGALAVAAPLVLLGTRIRRSPFHPAIAFGLPYFFITAGPLLRYLLYGVEPYGIHLEMMGRAMLVAAAAQARIFLGCAAARATVFRPARYLVLRRPRRLRRAACRLCLAALGVAAVSLAARWRELGTVGKLDLGAGDALWTRIHYACFFLLLAFI